MSFLYGEFLGGFRALGLLLVRAVTGLAFILHGLPKLENAFGWMDKDAPSGIPGILQAAAAFAEVAGGGLLVVGLLTPVACLMLGGVMVGAFAIVHLPHSVPFVTNVPGQLSFELAAVYLAISVMILFTGPGVLSADAVLFRDRGDTSRP